MGRIQDGEKWTVTVGVTGHRFLGDEARIAAGIDLALDHIQRAFGHADGVALTILSSLASGADQLVARRALARPGTELIAPLPLPLADYARDFDSQDPLRELLAQAARVVELPPAATRDEAYLAAGRYVIEHCDVLVAVWDGRPARGVGGTADVVAAARRRGLPLAWVRARNRAPGAGDDSDALTSADATYETEGTVVYERFPPAGTGQDHHTRSRAMSPTDTRERPRPTTSARGPLLRRVRRVWQDYQWPILVLLLLGSLALGYAGFYRYASATGRALAPLDILYLTLQLAVFESGAVSGPVSWELEVARWLVPAVTAYTAVLAAASLFRKQLQLIRLRFLRGHVVICGLGEKGSRLAAGFCDSGYRVVVIEREEDNPHVAPCRDRGAIVLAGDATDPALLSTAAVGRASHLISVCSEDGANAEVAVGARDLTAGRKRGALTCTIHLVDPQLCELLRERELGGASSPAFRLELFNIFDRGARVLLNRYPPPAANRDVHLLVVGLGRMGESLVVHAARDWHEQRGEARSTLHITVVDEAAAGKVRSLHSRYPQLPVSCRLIPVETRLGEPAFEEASFLFDEAGARHLDRIYVCLGDHARGLQAALALRRRLGQEEPPIVVRMPERVGLATLLDGGEGAAVPFRNLHPFGSLERTCTPDLVLGGTHELLARGFHEAYLAGRRREGELAGGDRALVPWEALPEDLKESNRRQVDRAGAGLRAAGYAIRPLTDWDAGRHRFEAQEIELMARLEHEQWTADLRRQGWRHDPESKDAEKKTHPDLIPWEGLSEEAKAKNRLAMEVLPGLLARAGFQVYRPGG
jgi:hypothetical protein